MCEHMPDQKGNMSQLWVDGGRWRPGGYNCSFGQVSWGVGAGKAGRLCSQLWGSSADTTGDLHQQPQGIMLQGLLGA